MRTLKRVAAILCSAAVLTGIGLTAYAQETVSLKEREGEFDPDVVNVIADQVYAKAGEKVEYTVQLYNNANTDGYTDSGISLMYDSRLTPAVKAGTVDKPDASGGQGVGGLGTAYSLNLDLCVFGASTYGTTACKSDGTYVTTWFTVPTDAKPGDVFPMKLVVDKWLDQKTEPVSYYKVNGWIKIKEDETTTTSTTESTTTTTLTTSSTTGTTTTSSSTTETTSTTTGSSTTSTETTSSTTGTSTDTTSSTTGTTTSTESTTTTTLTTSSTTTETTTITTTSTLDKTTKTVTKSTAPDDVINSTTKAPGASTGDAGVGVAVAALAASAAAAVVFGRKRKED